MRSFIIVEVEHGDTTDGVNEALFNMGIGSALDPQADDQWPTGDDGETWMHLHGCDYTITDYSVVVDLPPYITSVNAPVFFRP
jgi:hypothetical protein